MPTALLSILPVPYRWLILAILSVALFGTGFVKGLNYEHGKMEAQQATALQAQINQTVKLAQKITDDGIAFKKQRDAEVAKSASLKTQLDAMQALKQQYQSCKQDAEIFKKLQGAVDGK